MRYLGIDFGTKKIGIAISDEKGSIAFPKMVIANDKQLLSSIKQLVDEYSVSALVIGESKDIDGKENPVMREAREFVEEIKEFLDIDIIWEREDFTSQTVRETQGEISKSDASAAALILQAFLDRNN